MRITCRLVVVATLAAALGCEREGTGSTFRYEIALSVASPETLAAPVEVKGRVDVIPISASAVVARFAEPPSSGSARLADESAAELMRPVVIEYDGGRLRGIRFASGSSPGTRRLWGQLAVMTQRPVARAEQWTSKEADDTGAYQAEYRVNADRSLAKQKLAYDDKALGLSIVRSAWTLREVPGSPWANADGSEELELKSAMARPVHATVRGSVAGAPSKFVLELPQDAPLTEPLAVPGAFVTKQEVARQHDRNLTQGSTVRSIVDEWRKTDDEARRIVIGDRLASLSRVNAAAVPQVKQLIGSDPALSGLAFRALSQAGTPEAQRTLLEVLTSADYDQDRRLSAGQALATSAKVDPQLTDELVRGLRSLTGDVKGAALLAYGAWIRRLREASSPEANRHIRDLLGATREAVADAAEYRRHLDALGNTGAPEVEEVVTAALSNESEEVREVAVGSLRALPTPNAERVISQTMLRDRSPRVRAAAILAASFRPVEGFLPALGELLRVEPRPFVRKRAVAWLGSRAKEVPGARELLERQARVDADQGVREQARRFLVGGPAAPVQKGTGKP